MHNNIKVRIAKRLSWLNSVLGNETSYQIEPLAGDASFRSYFRVQLSGKTFILMDAPPEKEHCAPFVEIDQLLIKQGIPVPELFHINLKEGFILLEDFGDLLFATAIKDDPDTLYKIAIKALNEIQKISPIKNMGRYDRNFIHTEMARFETWFMDKLLGRACNSADQKTLSNLSEYFLDIAMQQPYCLTHRDYHSRNILIPKEKTLGIIDFQDAIIGPVVYDLVSLLKDCYLAWPRKQVEQWCLYAFETFDLISQSERRYSFDEFLMWFDMIGMQRHIKVLGIFARLSLRDNKTGYLKEIPRVLHYVQEVISLHSELKPLFTLFDTLHETFLEYSIHV